LTKPAVYKPTVKSVNFILSSAKKVEDRKRSSIMKNFFKFFGIIALIAIICFGMMACGDDDDNDIDSRLILGSGQAWTDYFEYGAGESDGIIFRANGTFSSINNYNGPWVIDDSGTFTASGGILNIAGEGIMSYSISGNSLFVDGKELRITNVGNLQ
jgi:hypothetical protein